MRARSLLSMKVGMLCLSLSTGCGGGQSENPGTVTVTATVAGLDPNARYYFAVNAYNGSGGPCSNEVSTVTPPSGSVSLAWDGVKDQMVSVYYVHYGKQSLGQSGDCNYPDWIRVP